MRQNSPRARRYKIHKSNRPNIYSQHCALNRSLLPKFHQQFHSLNATSHPFCFSRFWPASPCCLCESNNAETSEVWRWNIIVCAVRLQRCALTRSTASVLANVCRLIAARLTFRSSAVSCVYYYIPICLSRSTTQCVMSRSMLINFP